MAIQSKMRQIAAVRLGLRKREDGLHYEERTRAASLLQSAWSGLMMRREHAQMDAEHLAHEERLHKWRTALQNEAAEELAAAAAAEEGAKSREAAKLKQEIEASLSGTAPADEAPRLPLPPLPHPQQQKQAHWRRRRRRHNASKAVVAMAVVVEVTWRHSTRWTKAHAINH